MASLPAFSRLGPSSPLLEPCGLSRIGLITSGAPNQTSDCKRGGGILSARTSTSNHKAPLMRRQMLVASPRIAPQNAQAKSAKPVEYQTSNPHTVEIRN
jgi:hypothetical protein